jgi:hypothetical protein
LAIDGLLFLDARPAAPNALKTVQNIIGTPPAMSNLAAAGGERQGLSAGKA